MDEVFASAAPDDEVLFALPVTKTWLRQLTLGLTMICHSSYRGVVELMRDLLGVAISEGTVHNVHQAAARQAGAINRSQDLSTIRVGLHDEIFQGSQPVLAGVDARSTYCYLLAAAEHRDADTWGIHLLDASEQGLNPDYTIADAGQGLRAGQKAAWGDKPCHGDVFHIQHQCEGLANTLAGIAKGAKSRRKKLQTKTRKMYQATDLGDRIALALRAEAGAHALAGDIRTLTAWLAHDVLALAGPNLEIRKDLFDFIVAEFSRRESDDPRRIRPVRIALQNQRDDLLAFAGVLDNKLSMIARAHQLPENVVRAACVLHRKPRTSPAYWQGWNRLRARIGATFHAVFDAVAQAMAQTPRSSALVENLNSRLRKYFTLRRQLGGSYLDLLRFFLNHRSFLRSRVPDRIGKSPTQLMTGKDHPHWLSLLGFGPLQPQRA
ncbi:hypothetical protein BN2497_5803 [Janthinobacterium sp. CG23_2]|nr:hypothetical protein BN2497_5803 [Janthinobacterium sp. CG23_2]CUU29299.1 hypothetical protein BN3177_5803 [Janthinobacterium sp. CG23_2]